MSHFLDEELHELEIGKSYTAKQLRIFLCVNEDTEIICDTARFEEYDNKLYVVIDKFESYLHMGGRGTYHIPSIKKRIYKVN